MTDDNSALLKEYELCEQRNHSMSHEILDEHDHFHVSDRSSFDGNRICNHIE